MFTNELKHFFAYIFLNLKGGLNQITSLFLFRLVRFRKDISFSFCGITKLDLKPKFVELLDLRWSLFSIINIKKCCFAGIGTFFNEYPRFFASIFVEVVNLFTNTIWKKECSAIFSERLYKYE